MDSSVDLASLLPKGTIIDKKFELIELVASGGMGFIYRARQLSSRRLVALKIMRDVLRNEPRSAKRFEREARTVSRLFHPNTVSMIAFGATEDGMLYIAMEWLEGLDLAHVLKTRGRLNTADALTIVIQVTKALAEAHDKGIVHRDLKPENIFLVDGQVGVIKVLDFGIAKIVSGPVETQITQLGMICGTPDFMSPEQARGEPIDGRTDIYAVGCLLYNILTGEAPFHTGSALKTVMRHLSDQLPQIPDIHPAVNTLMLRCAAKEPGNRFDDAKELVQVLEQTLELVSSDRPRSLATDISEYSDTVVDMPELEGDLGIAATADVGPIAEVLRAERREQLAETEDTPLPPEADLFSADLAVVETQDEDLDASHSETPPKEDKAGEDSKHKGTIETEIARAPRGKILFLAIALLLIIAGGFLGVYLTQLLIESHQQDQADEVEIEVVDEGIDEGSEGAKPKDPLDPKVPDAVVKTKVSIVGAPMKLYDREGGYLGETPLTLEDEGAIDFVLRAEAAGFLPLERLIQVEKGESAEINLALSPLPKIKCRIQSKPKGAELYRGSERLGQTPLNYDFVEGESVDLRLELAGYQSDAFELEVKPPCRSERSLKRQ